MSYRDDMRQVEREARWSFFRFLPLFLIVVAVLGIVGAVTNGFGLVGRTVVEREVFKRSYQRSAAVEAQIATDEATLAEIERKLLIPTLDDQTRAALEAQASATRVRLSAARRQQ